jgi:hypothetical protein
MWLGILSLLTSYDQNIKCVYVCVSVCMSACVYMHVHVGYEAYAIKLF